MGGTRKARYGKCVVCKVRQARRALGPTCDPCCNRVTAENTYKKMGLKKLHEKERYGERVALIKAYNALVRKGLLQTQIAELWGVHPRTLSSKVSKWSAATGKKALVTRNPGRRKDPTEPKAVGRPRNEHGGGKGGVTGCECEPCQTTRRAHAREKFALKMQRKKNLPS